MQAKAEAWLYTAVKLHGGMGLSVGTLSPGTVDLHTHSRCSDGTMSPEQVLAAAQASGVSVLAITDHDVLEGARTLQHLAQGSGVYCVTGVELDAVEQGINFHILGYGMALQDAAFSAFCQENRTRLEEVSRKLISKLEADGVPVSLAEYDGYSYDPHLGGWTALHYFLAKGLSSTLMGGLAVYGRYGSAYTWVNFPGVAEVARQIHAAGGLAILAHPGEVLPTGNLDAFRAQVCATMACGLDGIECHYAFHSPEVTDLCLSLCRANGWIVTCGSDCHGDFGRSRVGQLPVTAAELPGLARILQAQATTPPLPKEST